MDVGLADRRAPRFAGVVGKARSREKTAPGTCQLACELLKVVRETQRVGREYESSDFTAIWLS